MESLGTPLSKRLNSTGTLCKCKIVKAYMYSRPMVSIMLTGVSTSREITAYIYAYRKSCPRYSYIKGTYIHQIYARLNSDSHSNLSMKSTEPSLSHRYTHTYTHTQTPKELTNRSSPSTFSRASDVQYVND